MKAYILQVMIGKLELILFSFIEVQLTIRNHLDFLEHEGLSF